jgi:dTDP-4-amino-4,6-dideoxygalactose transaminase
MTESPIIPLAVPDLRGNEAAYLARCVADNWVSSAGPDVRALEDRLAALGGVDHAVATVNGTTALHLALIAAGVGPGDLVAVPDFTFVATANAVVHAGARPLFVDVDEVSWTLDPAALARAFEIHGKAIAAVIPVHALGHPADMDALLDIARTQSVPVVEDAAGAIGARYRGRPVGGLGDAAMFSFNGNKTVTAGGGGALLTRNTAWADRARSLSTQARDGNAYRYGEVGFNYRMPNINAALGLAQLERLDEMVAAKRAIAARYDKAFASRDDVRPMPRAGWAESACWLYSVRCADARAANALVEYLSDERITARVAWQSLSQQPPYADAPSVLTGVAARLSGAVVSLPCSSSLTVSDQDRVLSALAAWHGAALQEVSA